MIETEVKHPTHSKIVASYIFDTQQIVFVCAIADIALVQR